MRILAVDYGGRRTGLAVSDELGITAQGLDTVVVDDELELPAEVARIAGSLGVERIVIGLPLNMDGTESGMSDKVRTFGEILTREIELPVVFWDERLTSTQAQRVMRDLGMKTRGNKHAVDRISATLMLQEYLKTLT